MKPVLQKMTMFAGLMLASLLFSHCTKENDVNDNGTEGLNGDLPIPAISVSAEKHVWMADDRIRAFIVPDRLQHTAAWNSYQTEYGTDETNAGKNRFLPEDSIGLVSGEIYDWCLVRPSARRNAEEKEALDFSFEGQVQDPKDPKAHLKAYELMVAQVPDVPAEQQPALFHMEKKSAELQFLFENTDARSSIHMEKIEFSVPEGVNIGGLYSIDFQNGGILRTKKASNKATLTFSKPQTVRLGSQSVAYLAAPAFRLQAGNSVQMKVYTDDGVIDTESYVKTMTDIAGGSTYVFKAELYYVYVEKMFFDKPQLVLKEGETSKLTVSLLPENAHNKVVTWSSSAPEIVQVDDQGNLTAGKCGAAVITAAVKKSGVSVECPVNVVAADVQYETVMAGNIKIPLVKIDGGTFMMGATKSQEQEAASNEKPLHQVTLSDYYIGQYEVSQELWEAVMGTNPSTFKGQPDHPVEHVSWDLVVNEFLPKLNQMTGKNFTLPTEAQWEYAARGGKKGHDYIFSGSDILTHVGWFYGVDDSTFPIGTKLPNELGIYDMSGGVYEWCSDWFGPYLPEAQTNPTGPATGEERVMRGGSCIDYETHCRVSLRRSMIPEWGFSNHGFRLCLKNL